MEKCFIENSFDFCARNESIDWMKVANGSLALVESLGQNFISFRCNTWAGLTAISRFSLRINTGYLGALWKAALY